VTGLKLIVTGLKLNGRAGSS